jgi:hypothetical protein
MPVDDINPLFFPAAEPITTRNKAKRWQKVTLRPFGQRKRAEPFG